MKTEIKAEDLVHVKDWGCMYSTCVSWFLEHKDDIPMEWAIRYAYEDAGHFVQQRYEDDKTYIVLYVDQDKALISSYINHNKVYLIRVDTLVPAKKKMTLEEIEAELGYKIELIKS